MPPSLRRLAPVPLLLLLAAGFYWKLALTDQYVWFDHPDMCYIEVPRLQFQAAQFHQGRFPLWDPFIWMGQPLIGQTQPGPLYPLNILLSLLPLDEHGHLRFRFLNLYWVAIHFLASLACYALCREMGRSRTAGVLAGCAFSFGGFIGTVAWLDVVNGAVWTPLVFLFFFRVQRGYRPWASAALGGLFLGLIWLSGHHEIPLLVSCALAASWGAACWRAGRLVRYGGAFFLIAGLVAAAQLWPTLEFGHLSKRWVGLDEAVGWNDKIPYLAHTVYSMPARGLLGLLVPGQGNWADSTSFIGVVAVALALYGLLTRWSEPRVRWLAAFLGLAALYTLGAHTPLHGVLYAAVPMLGKARIPVRALHLVHFALAALAAYGLDAWLAREERRVSRWVLRGLGGLAALLLGAALVNPSLPGEFVMAGLVAGVTAGILAAWRAGRLTRATVVCVLGAAMLTELYPAGTQNYSNKHDKERNKFVRSLTDFHDIAGFLHSEPGPRRVTVDDQAIPTNFGDWHGIDVMEGYAAGVTVNLLRHERQSPTVQRIFAITHHVGKQPSMPGQADVFTGASGVKVFRNAVAPPRAWMVHEAAGVKEDWELRVALQDPAFDPAHKTILLGDVPTLEQCGGDVVELERRNPDRVTLKVKAACRGMLVVSENYYPGWEARVDGAPARVWEAYGAIRGVVVEAGDRQVELRYRPRSVYGGGALLVLGLLLASAIILWDRRRDVA